jgi:hypothetical protein
MAKIMSTLLVPLLFCSCSLLKASPRKEFYFLPNPSVLSHNPERAPFHYYWVFDPLKYSAIRKERPQISIEKVSVDHVKDRIQRSRLNERSKRIKIEEAEELARYFEEKIKLEIDNRKDITVSEENDGAALKLKLALVDVLPTDPAVNVVGTVLGFVAYGGGLVKYFGEGSVAMEGFTSLDDKALEQFADREGQKLSAFSLKDYQRYAHIRVALDEWAQQIVELLTTPPDHQVEDSDPISINPL